MIENNEKQKNYYLDHHSQITPSWSENINIQILGFNKGSSILVMGKTDGKIQIYQFILGDLKLITELNDTPSQACSLLFSNKQNQMIFLNNNLKIYSEVGINRGCHLFKDVGPKPNCLIINKDENLLISGSNDKSIRFFKNTNNQWSCHQKYHLCYQGGIVSLSLNDSETYLICLSEAESKLYICQKNQLTNFWSFHQIINCKGFQALQICFIKDSIFILQSENEENFQYYHQNQKNLYFELFTPVIQDEECDPLYDPHLFQLQVIKDRQFFMYRKNNCIILLIQRENSFDFVKFNITQFDQNLIFTATDDGKYVLIWLEDEKQFKVQILKES